MTQSKQSHQEKEDEVKRDEVKSQTKSEGAPKTETPESPTESPKGTSRDKEPRLETPESPVGPPEEEEAEEKQEKKAEVFGNPQKPKSPVAATPTLTAISAALTTAPSPMSNDEAALICAQHNL